MVNYSGLTAADIYEVFELKPEPGSDILFFLWYLTFQIAGSMLKLQLNIPYYSLLYGATVYNIFNKAVLSGTYGQTALFLLLKTIIC